VLPAVRPSAGIFGETDDLAWLPAGVPVAGVAGDQQAALFGQACHAPGQAKNTYGTGCFLLLCTGEAPVASRRGLVTTIAWRIGQRTTYALEGSIFIAGALVQWLRDGLGLIRTAAESEALAASVPDAGGVYLVPAFVGLGAPHWDAYARGTIVGITRGTTAGHLARAALEAIAYQTLDVLEVMTAEASVAVPALRVDGGAVANDLLCQIQADVLGVPVLRPALIETTGLGAAYLAGVGAGLWSTGAVAERAAIERTFSPSLPPDTRTRRHEGWRRAVERAKGWAAES
jgi:glycerol kinase